MATQWNVHTAGAIKAGLKWFQKLDVSNIDKGPNLLNAEYIEAINAAGTSRVNVIGLDASNVVQLPQGASIPTGKTLTITDAGGLVGGMFFITQSIPGGAAAGDYDVTLPIPVACVLVAVRERHQTLGTDGSAVTIMVTKVPSGTAKSAGTACLAAGISLKAANDTVQSPALHATVANYTFAANDGVGLVLTGTPTAVDGVGLVYQFRTL